MLGDLSIDVANEGRTPNFQKFLEVKYRTKARKLVVGLTSHLNNLAAIGQEVKISAVEAEAVLSEVVTNVQQSLPNTPAPESPKNPIENYPFFNALSNAFNSPELRSELFRNAERIVTHVQSKGK
jgi:hypothetical protein